MGKQDFVVYTIMLKQSGPAQYTVRKRLYDLIDSKINSARKVQETYVQQQCEKTEKVITN